MDTTLLLTTGFMSLSYLAVAFVITPANARYLLAGYNTMSEEKQQAFDIDRYLAVFFKPFFKRKKDTQPHESKSSRDGGRYPEGTQKREKEGATNEVAH